MSFANTHTPLRSEITGKARYQCPMHKVRGVDAYYLTPELEERWIIYYTPDTKRGEIREKNGRALGFRFEPR